MLLRPALHPQKEVLEHDTHMKFQMVPVHKKCQQNNFAWSSLELKIALFPGLSQMHASRHTLCTMPAGPGACSMLTFAAERSKVVRSGHLWQHPRLEIPQRAFFVLLQKVQILMTAPFCILQKPAI